MKSLIKNIFVPVVLLLTAIKLRIFPFVLSLSKDEWKNPSLGITPFMPRQGSPERSRKARHEPLNLMTVVLLLATLCTTGLAQADDKNHRSKKHDKTAELKVTQAGAGQATVTSSPAGIDCGDTCRAEFNRNSQVTLTATAATGSTFKRWSGACKGTTPTCTVTLKEAQNATAIIDLLPITLNVAKTGTGTGTVTSVPVGIDCGTTCSAIYTPKQAAHDDDSGKTREHEDSGEDYRNDDDHDHEHGHGKPAASVTLTATPATGSIFEGWTGACTGTVSTCTVTMDQTRNVSAHFALMQMPLAVAKTGSGTGGTITSLQTGIDCGATCSAIYDWGTPVTLAVTPATGSVFKGWSGACTGTDSTCTVTLEQTQTISADFAPMPMALTAAKTGAGTGTLTSQPAGIDCGATCSAVYDWATQVTLTATPASDATFEGWSGACTGTVATCTVTLDQVQNVAADFAPASKTLSLTKTGSGTGTIISSPPGIDCGATCSATFAAHTSVTLTATPATGSTFQGWFGACTGSASTCTVTLSKASSVSAVFSAPAITTYQYDANGNLTRIIDPLGRVRQYQYDALNQPTRQLEPHPSLIGNTLGQTDTAYDSLGQIKSITDPRNLTTTYTTDSLGNLSQQTSPDTGTTTADHDPAGNVVTRTDARNKTASYSYDSLNRITQIAYDDQTVAYTWDSCANGIGRLCSLSNNNSNLSYSYDSHGRLTNKTQSQSAAATPLTVSHTYNTAGQRISSTSPGGQTIDYQWAGNRITAIARNGQPVISQITYDPDGQVNGWVWGNNQQHERFHDLAGRPVIVSLGFDAQSQLPNSRYYGYDAAGRQTSAIDDIDPKQNQHHDYDPLDRLTSSQRGEVQTSRTDYAYDLSGNRSEKIKDSATLHSYSTDPNSNRLQSQGGAQNVNYSYDPSGNLTGDGAFNHSYNAAGRRIATTSTATGQTTTYGYDALGQRISKTHLGNTSQYFYDEQGHLTGEYDAAGRPIQEIIWLDDLPVAVLKPATNSGATPDFYYIHADHLGTPRKITRPNDNRVVWSWESEAFGNSLPDQNPSGLETFVFNLRFPGQYYDQETGLFYNYFRDYDPAKGSYIESDPIGLAGGINTYSYVGGNPVNAVDPLGLTQEDIDAARDVAREILTGTVLSDPNGKRQDTWGLPSNDRIKSVPEAEMGIHHKTKKAPSADTDQWNNLIRINFDRFGGCLTDDEAKVVLDAIIHEGIHWSLPYFDPRQKDDNGSGYPYTETHNKLMTKIIIEKFLAERKKRNGCECQK
jgi:RHS repeat-associated protein/uncharacterized repeat protein (TIGR02543 family)